MKHDYTYIIYSIMKHDYRFLCLVLLFAWLFADVGKAQAQLALSSLSCGSASVEFDNPSGEERTLNLFLLSANDTTILREDFSNFPNAQSGGMICNSSQLLRLPDSYTLCSGYLAKRLYSPNSDTCHFAPEGELQTPLIDVSAYHSPLRLRLRLKTTAAYPCVFSVFAEDGSGASTERVRLTVPAGSEYSLDTLLSFSEDRLSLRFLSQSFIAMDDLSLSCATLETTLAQSRRVSGDTCVFNGLLPNRTYLCTLSESEDSLLFTAPEAVDLGVARRLSPYGADFSLDCCDEVVNRACVLLRHSDEESVFATDLFFSQIASTNAYNRAVEIYNGTGEDICLAPYRIVTDIHIGTGAYSSTVSLGFCAADTIRADSCIVVMQALQAMNGNTKGVFYVNPSVYGTVVIDGNDPIALVKGNDTVDLFGNFAECVPNSTGWQGENIRTAKTVLQRRAHVTKGVRTNTQSGFPTLETEWQQVGNIADASPENFSDFGSHTMDGAVGGAVLDSVSINLSDTAGFLRFDTLNSNTLYSLCAVGEVNGQQMRSQTQIFLTGKRTARSASGVWFDENWTAGIPSARDEAVVGNGQRLTLSGGDTAHCYRLTLLDTVGENRAEFRERGVLVCEDALRVDMHLRKDGQSGVSHLLFGFPIEVAANREALAAYMVSQGAIEFDTSLIASEPLQTQSYPLSLSDTTTLTFKGKTSNRASYDLLSPASFGLSGTENATLLSYNPYPFTVSVQQLLREGVSLPQRLDSRSGNFVPVSENDSLQPYEGFLLEYVEGTSAAILTSTPLTPTPEEQNERLLISLRNQTLSDEVRVDFVQDAGSDFSIERDCHKYSLAENPMTVACLALGENFSRKSLPVFSDTAVVELLLQLPRLDAYTLSVAFENMDVPYAARLFDAESGDLLFDFVQSPDYTFSSSQGTKYWRLVIYRTSSPLDPEPSQSTMRLVREGNVCKVLSQEPIESLQLFDSAGRELVCVKSKSELRLPSLGLFILRAETEKESKIWKIVNP